MRKWKKMWGEVEEIKGCRRMAVKKKRRERRQGLGIAVDDRISLKALPSNFASSI